MDNRQDCKSVLEWLKHGNEAHIAEFEADTSGAITFQVKASVPAHVPRAAILSCSDARVIPEHIFHADEGELFVVRVAGNISSPDVIASLEYAVAELGVQVIIVMGHEACGAVKAAMKFVETRTSLGYNLQNLVSYIVPAVNAPNARTEAEAIHRNASCAAEGLLERSEILSKAHDRREKPLLICTAIYHFEKLEHPYKPGQVEWFPGCECKK